MGDNVSKKWNFEAKTVEDAIEKALRKLECSREEVDVKVVSEEKKGLFGMEGAKPAKIKVTVNLLFLIVIIFQFV